MKIFFASCLCVWCWNAVGDNAMAFDWPHNANIKLTRIMKMPLLGDTHWIESRDALHTSHTAYTQTRIRRGFSVHKCYVWILQRLAFNDTASVVHYFHRLKPSNWLILVNPSFFIFQWSNLLYQTMASVQSTDANTLFGFAIVFHSIVGFFRF